MSSDGRPSEHATSESASISRLERENAQLRAELSRVNAERIEYLQNVSHQLVAPLNAIKWHIENITNNRIGVERAKKVLRSIYSQSTLAVHLAKNFALLSNLDADHALTALKEPLQEVPLLAMVINLADDFQPLGWDREIKISVVSDGGLKSAPAVLAMKPLVSQAFSNVIENAVKYSKRGSEIVIDGTHRPDADMVSVTVRNVGIPLAATDLERVFERGYRTQEAKNVYPAGTGFGLFIARRIVELHEGTLSAKSTRDAAIFELSLPIRALQGKARQRAAKDDSPYRR